MFGGSTKETLLWIGGMLVAAALTIFGVLFAVDNLLAVHDPTDPLERQGGLKKDQKAQ